ncbi:Uncharacterized protein PPKH_0213 [Pseudomonas putida]|nr:Uncharacterized protein PPKH_0213 [Pseudomonas putida]
MKNLETKTRRGLRPRSPVGLLPQYFFTGFKGALYLWEPACRRWAAQA